MQIGQVFNPYKIFIGSFIPNALMSYKGLSSTAKLCWARLAQYSGKNIKCYPSQDALADEIGVSIIQVKRLIKELVDKRFIDIERSGIDKIQHKTNRYIFRWHECFDTSQSIIDDTSPSIVDDTSAGIVDDTSIVRESVVRESTTLTDSKKQESVNDVFLKRESFKRAAKYKQLSNPDINILKDYISLSFKDKFGEPMLINQGKDGKILKSLLYTYKIDRLKDLWDKFINLDDKFIKKAGYSIGIFQSQINKLLSTKDSIADESESHPIWMAGTK